jgi:PAS domain-containing protein
VSDSQLAWTSNATAMARCGDSLEDPVERERAIGAVRDGGERYREPLENANEIIFTHDLASYFTSLNAAAIGLTAYTHEEALGLRLTDVVTPQSPVVVREMHDRRLSGEREALRELTIRPRLHHL